MRTQSQSQNQQNSPRRVKVTIGPLAINQLHYSNPWVMAFWSFFFPGFGQLMLGQYIQGGILFGWEVFINVHSQFNVAIMYSLTGRFDLAKHVLHANWLLLYGTVFAFSFWASYQLAVQTNNLYYLANRENAPVKIFEMNAFQYSFLDKRKPWIGALWSLLMPGLGELYNRRIPSAVFVLGCWVLICDKSHGLLAIYYSLYGEFHQAISVLNPEWALFLPSMYAFTFYNSYSTTVDRNTLFDKEQASYLKQSYQFKNFNMTFWR